LPDFSNRFVRAFAEVVLNPTVGALRCRERRIDGRLSVGIWGDQVKGAVQDNEKLRAENADLKQKMDDLTQHNNSLKAEVEDVKKENMSLRKDNAELRSEMDALKRDNASTKSSIDDLKDLVQQLSLSHPSTGSTRAPTS